MEPIEIFEKGTVEIIRKEDLLKKLAKKKKLRIKWGADPSAPDIHLGHCVTLRKLRQFQDLGHAVVFIVGDFTAMIGDPSGQSKTRPALSKKEVLKNAKTYQEQVFKILDKKKTEVVFNSKWLSKLSMEELTKLAGQFTVSQVLDRADFHDRFLKEQPISLHEFLYPIYQGYDSVQVKADVEIGGTDQKWNLLVGRTMQEKTGLPPQVVITMPLLEGTDGVQKMSKSLGNYVGVTDSPEDMFGKIMSIPDVLIKKYNELLAGLEEIDLSDPRNAKAAVAYRIVEWIHGLSNADKAHSHFDRVVRNRTIRDDDRNRIFIPDSNLSLIDIVKHTKRAISNTSASTLIKQNAVRINGAVKNDGKEIFSTHMLKVDVGRYYFIFICKKELHLE